MHIKSLLFILFDANGKNRILTRVQWATKEKIKPENRVILVVILIGVINVKTTNTHACTHTHKQKKIKSNSNIILCTKV